ncbi:SseB family protein [Actinoplanes sp. HUAS TT8]|uniref:SseB family protein n=1 Tax=Actinoplanes sp. HUAS TT8 TaxID=3447453 RepID=UPI003F528992
MTAPAWEPANPVEEALLAAGLADDRQMFFQVVASADLYLPQMSGLDGPQRFLTIHALGQVFLPVFTSARALAQQYGQAVDGYTLTNFAELSRKWPDPDWRLAINPGTPLDAYLSIESLMQAALGDLKVPTMHELVKTAEQDEILDVELRDRHANAGPYPEDDAEALRAALDAGDVYGYVDRLLDMNVLIPVARPAEPEEILEAGFPWQPGADRMIEVFTSAGTLARRHPVAAPEVVEVALAFALAAWPDEHGVSVDPDSAGAFALPADQVLALLAFRPD